MFEKNFVHHNTHMPHKIFLTFLELRSKTTFTKKRTYYHIYT